MRRMLSASVTAVSGLLTLPASAFAGTAESVAPALRVGTGFVGLLVAAILLFEALRIRRAMAGSAVADKITWVILSTVCLAASAILVWAENFVPASAVPIVAFAAQLLVLSAMALLAGYFYAVRHALESYLTALTGSAQIESAASGSAEAGEG